jgi:hypothetical protein
MVNALKNKTKIQLLDLFKIAKASVPLILFFWWPGWRHVEEVTAFRTSCPLVQARIFRVKSKVRPVLGSSFLRWGPETF